MTARDRRTRRGRIPALGLVVALLVSACSADTEPGPDLAPEPAEAPSGSVPELADATLGVAAATAFERVAVEGLEPGVATTTVVHLEGVDALPRPVLLDEDGTFIIAPVHPTEAGGGTVSLRFESPAGVGPTVTLDVAPPDGADGSFAAARAALRDTIDQRAAAAGVSLDELSNTPYEELDPSLRHVKVARSWAEMADAVAVELDEEEREQLDRIAGAAGLEPLFASEAAPLPETPDRTDALAVAYLGRLADAGGCIPNQLDISTPQELSNAMLAAAAAGKLSGRQGPRGQALETVSWVLSAVGLAPGATGKIASAMAFELAAFDAIMNGIAGLNPTRLISLTAAVTPTGFDEDSTRIGAFENIELSAASTGWSADDDVINVLLNLASVLAPGAEQGEKVERFAIDTAAELTNRGINSDLQSLDESVINFCAANWTVPVKSPGFTQGRALLRRLTIDNNAFTFKPREVGPDTLLIEVFPAPFAGQYVKQETPVETHEIDVDLYPEPIVVDEAGDTVAVNVSVEHAENDALEWNSGRGVWADGLGADTNGITQRLLQTPTNEDDYPFEVVAESTSRSGLRADGTPPRYDTVKVVLAPFDLTATPDEIRPGELSMLEATDKDDNRIEVTWSVTGGQLTETGIGTATFTSQEPGRYEVTATNEAGLTRTVVIDVIDGECSFAYTVGGTRFVGRPGDTVSWYPGDDETRLRMGDAANAEFQAQLTFTTSAGMGLSASGDGQPVTGTGPYEIRFVLIEIQGEPVAAIVAPPDKAGDVEITEHEAGVTVSGSGAGEALNPDGGFQVPPVPFSFEFAVTDLGDDIFPAAAIDCFVAGEPPSGT